MKTSKLIKLIDQIKESNKTELLAVGVISLNNSLSAKIYGGNPPVDSNCTNNSCSNPLCSSGTNNTCTNTGCRTQGMTNSGCTNSSCINGQE